MVDHPNDLVLITRSGAYASLKHAGQTRKELNEAYINHPLRCGEIAAAFGYNAEFIAGMHLHDVVEDTPTTLAEIAMYFPPRTVKLVDALTKKFDSKGLSADELSKAKDAYYTGIVEAGAVPGKVIDRIDNLRDMNRTALRSPAMHRWASAYLSKTLTEISPLAHRYSDSIELVELFDATVAMLATTLAKYPLVGQ